MVLHKARSRWISQENQVHFEQTLKLSINLLIFPMVNTFPWMKTRLIRFPPSCRVNLLGRIFLKGTKHWFFVLFLSYIYFFGNDIFSKWWNKHFRGARNHFFFHYPNIVDRPLNNFLENFQKILSVDFTLWWWYLCWYNFLEKEVKNI